MSLDEGGYSGGPFKQIFYFQISRRTSVLIRTKLPTITNTVFLNLCIGLDDVQFIKTCRNHEFWWGVATENVIPTQNVIHYIFGYYIFGYDRPTENVIKSVTYAFSYHSGWAG